MVLPWKLAAAYSAGRSLLCSSNLTDGVDDFSSLYVVKTYDVAVPLCFNYENVGSTWPPPKMMDPVRKKASNQYSCFQPPV